MVKIEEITSSPEVEQAESPNEVEIISSPEVEQAESPKAKKKLSLPASEDSDGIDDELMLAVDEDLKKIGVFEPLHPDDAPLQTMEDAEAELQADCASPEELRPPKKQKRMREAINQPQEPSEEEINPEAPTTPAQKKPARKETPMAKLPAQKGKPMGKPMGKHLLAPSSPDTTSSEDSFKVAKHEINVPDTQEAISIGLELMKDTSQDPTKSQPDPLAHAKAVLELYNEITRREWALGFDGEEGLTLGRHDLYELPAFPCVGGVVYLPTLTESYIEELAKRNPVYALFVICWHMVVTNCEGSKQPFTATKHGCELDDGVAIERYLPKAVQYLVGRLGYPEPSDLDSVELAMKRWFTKTLNDLPLSLKRNHIYYHQMMVRRKISKVKEQFKAKPNKLKCKPAFIKIMQGVNELGCQGCEQGEGDHVCDLSIGEAYEKYAEDVMRYMRLQKRQREMLRKHYEMVRHTALKDVVE